MAIPFTQFLMPDARRRQVEIDRPPEIESLALALQDAGHRFEIEMLTTGEVSMTIEVEVNGEDVTRSHQLCDNGPDVLARIDAMVREAHAGWQAAASAADG